jgi:phage terminase large subunit
MEMDILVSDHFFPLLDRKERYLILCGGAGSGKSEFAGRKIFYRCMTEGGHRFLVLRKIRKTVEESCVEVIRQILANNNVVHNYNKSERVITFINPAGRTNEILFDGLDDPEKVKSIKGITSIWMEELTEFTRQDFMQVDLRLREETGLYQQIMASFNPDEALGAWIKADFFDVKHPDSFVDVSTVEHNPIKEMRDKYVQILDRLNDTTAHKIYRLGLWALPTGRIFNWDVQPLPDIRFDEVFYGGDFGYSVDPAAFIKIYRKANEFWVEEIIYQTGLTNQALAVKIKTDPRATTDISYWDSAEPKSIQELYEAGMNARPAEKGPDSVRAGIDYLESVKVHVVQGSLNIISEQGSYRWKKDKLDNDLPEPVAFKNHAMDAIRYGICTHMRQAGAAFRVISHDISPD